MVVRRRPYQPSLLFVGKVRVYPTVEHLNGDSLANIMSGWKGLPETNTLAYYEHITDEKDLQRSALGPVL